MAHRRKNKTLSRQFSILASLPILLLFSFLLLSSLARAEDIEEAQLVLRGELPAIRANYASISLLMKDIDELIDKSLSTQKDRKSRERFSFQIKALQNSLEGRSLDALIQDRRLPDPAYGFNAYLQNFGERRIYIIDLDWGGWSNTYRLIGTDKVSLEAIRARLESFGLQHGTWFGGAIVQLMAFIVFFVTGWALTSSLKDGKSEAKVLTLLILGIAISLAGFILFATGTFQTWFPKTAIYKSSEFFSERYSAAIGFWALIIGLIGLIPVILALTSLSRRN